MNANNWTSIDWKHLKSKISTSELVFILFTLSDCVICDFAKKAISIDLFYLKNITPYLVEFQELNPVEVKAMEELLVPLTPQGRLYFNGEVVSVWHSITPGASPEDLNKFILGWLDRNLGSLSR